MGANSRVSAAGFLEIPRESATAMLEPKRERLLLEELCRCRRELATAVARALGVSAPEDKAQPARLSRFLAEAHAEHGPFDGSLERRFQRYLALRTEMALANMRLVGFIAKRYRNRGLADSDLLQEGFCGLLEAIDRFDLGYDTKLATYATWWIRQAIQSAVAAGAYPVRLAPRHLRDLARSQDEGPAVPGRTGGQPAVSAESMERILAATQPAVSLDERHVAFVQAAERAGNDREDENDLSDAVVKWMELLRPREREVLSYRFGLGGSPRLSLSQVGQMLHVSKERVRQIQEGALNVLRKKATFDSSLFHTV